MLHKRQVLRKQFKKVLKVMKMSGREDGDGSGKRDLPTGGKYKMPRVEEVSFTMNSLIFMTCLRYAIDNIIPPAVDLAPLIGRDGRRLSGRGTRRGEGE